MAEEKKKTQAQRAASGSKQYPGKKGASGNNKGKKSTDNKQEPELLWGFPVRLITAAASLAGFLIFLVMFLKPEGALTMLLMNFVHGLIGKVAFYVAIPALLYLFIIQAFSGKKPVILRSVCLLSFIGICGCLSQSFLNSNLPTGVAIVGALYNGGITGEAAGLICGGITLLIESLLGTWITCMILLIAAVITFLAAINITIPSIVRAFQNRPRADWEDEELELREEPAAVVVNHLAHKRIEHVEAKRQRKAEKKAAQEALAAIAAEKAEAEAKAAKKPENKVSDLMSQIDDVDSPVAAAETPVENDPAVDIILDSRKTVPEKPVREKVPHSMPPLLMEDPIQDGPIFEEEKPAPAPAPEPVPVSEPKTVKVTAKEAKSSAAQVAAEIEEAQAQPTVKYCFPPIDLLAGPSRAASDGTMEMRENTRRLNETLASFKIEAHIINVTRGPSVTRYEVELDKGVRLNKLTTCADDIALSLGASGVRIAAVPGKISVVGIEVPNKTVNTVTLREVIDSNEFNRAKSKSSFSVGKDINGNCIVGNISKLPHMLIAGTTGSGKSVCMNSIIMSLLYKASPEDVKLIMVDPKMVELGIYNGIPHLLIPVVTDPKKAAGSLQWAVTEMMRRYKSMSDAGVRDLESYNSIVEAEGEGNKLPQVVVIIDELADLMLVAAKEVEESICRIAQMGRAAGIHLIIATQRPSADVITGLMKANIPSRIAFAVSSAMESRIILDTQGAEKLVGRGDMLYAPIGAGKPLRVQGCFVSDAEVEAVATYVKDNFNVSYDQDVLEDIEKRAAQTGNAKAAATAADPEPSAAEMDGDEMLPAAVDVILETGQASVSMLQRRLKLGYARAARIVDEMEEKGIVGPFQGSKPRTILVTKEQWEAMKSGQPAQMEIDDLPFDDEVPELID